MSETKSYYAVIPASVRYDKRLCPNAKLLYGEVTALCNEKGYCWAQNKYFADLYGVEKETVSRWVASLVKTGHLLLKITYKPGTKEIVGRHLWLPTPIDLKINTPCAKDQYPIDEKIKENITVNNTNELVVSKDTQSPRNRIRRQSLPPDAEWIISLTKDSAYFGVDVERQVAKARRWAETNHRKFTRKFIVNWLNGADPIVATNVTPFPTKSAEEKNALYQAQAKPLVA